ncbi:unnamed protein product [Acanthosepion pharaonis]|uniref:Uncharacterized protein n=1 Tax=Acanthosepion pharaonis TaxID=158019 RepID=A0A812DR28_ACAPH|nr:unnamed protein product [Sepia pharaonis]
MVCLPFFRWGRVDLKIIEDDALSGVLAGIVEAARQREELTSVIAEASADRLAHLTPQEKAEAKRKAKAAKQTLQNPRGARRPSRRRKRTRTKALNKLLLEHRPALGNMVKVVFEALISAPRSMRSEKERAEVKAKPKLTKKDSAVLKALEDAGCPLCNSPVVWGRPLVRRHLRPGKAARPAAPKIRTAGWPHSGPAIRTRRRGADPDEELALLLAAGRISESDIAAKRAFEAAAGRPATDFADARRGVVEAAERQRSDGVRAVQSAQLIMSRKSLFSRTFSLWSRPRRRRSGGGARMGLSCSRPSRLSMMRPSRRMNPSLARCWSISTAPIRTAGRRG